MKYKICVYAICKNEEKFVDKWMDSVKDADLVIVTDTGSEDDTVAKLKKRGAKVYQQKITPWRFDEARNISLDHVPKDVDICICLDLDEILVAGWRQKLEEAWDKKCMQAQYLFTWSYHEDGSPNKQSIKEKIHHRENFKWIHPVHEILEYSGQEPKKVIFIEGLIVNHYPDLNKPRSQYLPLLELSAQENPTDSSTIFWLGREYMYHDKYDLAIATLQKHLSLPTAIWDEERSAAMRFIGFCYQQKADFKEAKNWYYKAIAECPDLKEAYLNLVLLGYQENNWPLTYAIAKRALAINKVCQSYLMEAACYNGTFDDYLAIAAYNMGLYEEALKHIKNALAQQKNNARLKSNLKIIKQKIKEVKVHD